jgi:SP family general alpha glucoside:H+ symporter-like MFS transporter
MLNPLAWNWGAKAGFFYGGTCVLSVVYTYFCIPEPIGRTYGELNVLFQQKVSARKFATTEVTLIDARELPTEPKNE